MNWTSDVKIVGKERTTLLKFICTSTDRVRFPAFCPYTTALLFRHFFINKHSIVAALFLIRYC